MTVQIIRTNGTEEIHTIEGEPRFAFRAIGTLIGAETLDVVNLRDGRVMLVDDDGYDIELVDHGPGPGPGGLMHAFRIERKCVRAKKPVNPEATRLYHAICHPGVTHEIVGDVAIVRDHEFGRDDEEEG